MYTQLDPKLISPVRLTDETIHMIESCDGASKKINGAMRNGDVYSLRVPPIEGVEFDKRYFRLCGIIDTYKGCELNACVMREVERDGEGKFVDKKNVNRRRFSVTPNICKNLGIEYKPGYELFSVSNDFVYEPPIAYPHKEANDIDYNNMSTYPISHSNGKISHILIAMKGIKIFADGHVVMENGVAYKDTYTFVRSLNVKTAIELSDSNGMVWLPIGTSLPFSVIQNEDGGILHNGYVCLNVRLVNDKYFKYLEPSSLDGVGFDELFIVEYANTNEEGKKPARPVTRVSNGMNHYIAGYSNRHFFYNDNFYDYVARCFEDIMS